MVYIVITVFNRRQYTKSVLECILNQDFVEYSIIIVDHGSTDGTWEMIQDSFPMVTLVRGDESMWWTAATNLGIRYAIERSSSPNDYVLTLNNDLEVGTNYLCELIHVSKLAFPCIVGSRSVYINQRDKMVFCGVTWNKYTAKYTNKLFFDGSEYVFSDLLPGRGTLIPIGLFDKVGYFDELRFPHYHADEDFSLRCKAHGYALVVSTRGVVCSHTEATGLNTKKTDSFKSFIFSLFSKKSPNNIIYRSRWALKNSPVPPVYFIFDISRLLGSYFRNRFF